MSKIKLHRDSQKRFYGEDFIYFITTNVDNRLPYFKEEIFCDLFIDCLKFCKKLKKFELYAFVIIPNHIHLLLKPSDEYNIFELMRSLKTNFSRDLNYVLGYNNESSSCNEGAVAPPRLQSMQSSLQNKKQNFPKFQWQKSYHDHVIRGERDFNEHLLYIWWNPEKHNIIDKWEEYEYSSYKNFQNLINDI